MEEEKKYIKRKAFYKVYPQIGVRIDESNEFVTKVVYKKLVFQTILRKKGENGVWYKIHLRKAYYIEPDKYSPEAIIDTVNEFHAEVYQVIIRDQIKMSGDQTRPRESVSITIEDLGRKPIFEMLRDKDRSHTKTDSVFVIDQYYNRSGFHRDPETLLLSPTNLKVVFGMDGCQLEEAERLVQLANQTH